MSLINHSNNDLISQDNNQTQQENQLEDEDN